MMSEREVALNLLTRLLAGEEGNLPMQVALLLEKSSPLRNSDDHYRKILPPELAELRFSPGTVEEVISTLCTQLSRDPRRSILAALSTTGTDTVTKAVVKLLVDPPRALGVMEYGQALGILRTFLPVCLKSDPNFLSEKELEPLVRVLRELQDLGDAEMNKAERMVVKRDAGQLLKRLGK